VSRRTNVSHAFHQQEISSPMTHRHAHIDDEMFEGERRTCPAHGTEYVRWVQSALNQARALRLPLSGTMDASTRSALRSFQRAQGLPPDGIAGPDSEQALRAELSAAEAEAEGEAEAEAEAEFGLDEGEAYAFETLDLESAASMPTLRRGSSGSAVSDLQRRLSAAGFNSGAVDGIFGSLTEAAVRSFQGARRLGVDGIVGPNTWGALLGAAPPNAPGVPGTASRVQLAQQVLNHSGISLWSRSPTNSSRTDGADAHSNVSDTAAGRAAQRSGYENAPGGEVQLDPRMLAAMLELAKSYRFGVTSIAGGSHSVNSRHYAGIAFDTYEINGVGVTSSNPHFRGFMQKCSELGAVEVLGPGHDAAHADHVHCAWPRP
jgi:peptidoglycan hydrolase-like protein with peptidoglycan-binding domain